jgi:hypothetical protein
MKRVLGCLSVLTLMAVHPCQAQTYLNAPSSASDPIVYSKETYPTAQNHYLVPPAGAVQAANTVQQPVIQQQVVQQPQVQYAAPVQAPQPASTYSYPYNYQAQQAAAQQPKPQPVASYSGARSVSAPIGLGTTNGFEFGAQGSWYRYQEHVVADQEFMHISGGKGGLTVDANKVFSDGTFIGGNVRGAYGHENYTGGDINLFTGQKIPSNHNDEDDMLLEGRIVAGHDFIFDHYKEGNFSLSPYAGLGMRFLYNDGGGQDSNGVNGYRRYSQYLYLPMGVTPRIRLDHDSRLTLNAEYDQLLYGWQVSSLGDSAPNSGDLVNNQYDGYGMRASAMYEQAAWSIGPFFNYWNINQSNSGCTHYATSFIICGVEPHNQTTEYGLQVRYRLDMGW